MDIDYLRDEILPQRRAEIKLGKNAGTANPIYLVRDLVEYGFQGHIDVPIMNDKNIPPKYKYYDTYLDETFDTYDDWLREIEDNCALGETSEDNLSEVTVAYIDKTVAYFLTRKAAEAYLKYQSHNLSSPYIYVDYAGYDNRQAERLMRRKAEKSFEVTYSEKDVVQKKMYVQAYSEEEAVSKVAEMSSGYGIVKVNNVIQLGKK